MKPRERFVRVLNFQSPGDRLPMVEWAAWWDQTIIRWRAEGLPETADFRQPDGLGPSLRYFGLDELYCLSARPIGPDCPLPAYHGAGILKDEAAYEAMLPRLYTDQAIERLCQTAQSLNERHQAGELSIRLWLDGFFWFPRSLFGIEDHFYAFYDQPDLMRRINEDLVRFHQRTLDALLPVLVPDIVGFAEDMSYNHGPMLSRDLFDQFIGPYYHRLVPRLKAAGMKVFVDSDGQVHELLPWLIGCGIEGIYPLERQSGVDVNEIRAQYPRFLMLGGFDKRVMNQGERAIRTEFERLLPAMRSGGYIPSVDHQTPPGVSLNDYRLYLSLFRKYASDMLNYAHNCTEVPHD
jgi:hypothetical protein